MTNVLLKGGRVFGYGDTDVVTDVRIIDGVVHEVGPASVGAEREIDCRGQYVCPALIDMHTHVFDGGSNVGMPPDEAGVRRGVGVVVDCGTAGSSNFVSFHRSVIDVSTTRVLSFLNVSTLGLVDTRNGELTDPSMLQVDEAVEMAGAYPDSVRGLKVRLSRNVCGDQALTVLEGALTVAERARLPLMVHIGNMACSMAAVVERLRGGDIVTHCYTLHADGTVEDGKVSEAVRAARRRGVLFDVGHGRTQTSHAIARSALADGFEPDLIGSDISLGNWNGPVYDLPTIMATMVALGMSIQAVIKATTRTAASVLKLDRLGYGSITPGQTARISVVSPHPTRATVTDATGTGTPVARLEPTLLIDKHSLHRPVAWRGDVPGKVFSPYLSGVAARQG